MLTTSLLSSDEKAKKKENERENFADHLRDTF